MKNILIALGVVSLLITSCTKGDELKNMNSFKKFEIVKIDNCEYINWGVAYGYINITHKGNCNNPAHNPSNKLNK